MFEMCEKRLSLTWHSPWRNEACLPAQWLYQKSFSSLPPPCASFPCLCTEGRFFLKGEKNIATQLLHESELTGKFGRQITNTYTKPKGLFVIRKSFLPWLTRRFNTAWVSLPLRMNLSERRGQNIYCAAVCWQDTEVSNVLPSSSTIHLYIYPLRWTMPIASCGLHKCTHYRSAYRLNYWQILY